MRVSGLMIGLAGVVTPTREGCLWLYRHTQDKPSKTMVKSNSSRKQIY